MTIRHQAESATRSRKENEADRNQGIPGLPDLTHLQTLLRSVVQQNDFSHCRLKLELQTLNKLIVR